MEVLGTTQSISIKEHICDFCNQKIEKGIKYNNSTCKFDSIVYSWKAHMSCFDLTGILAMEGDEGITSDDFWEYVTDAFLKLSDPSRDSEFDQTKKYTAIERLDYVKFRLKLTELKQQ